MKSIIVWTPRTHCRPAAVPHAASESRYQPSTRVSNVYLEREGERRIERVLEAVETTPWSIRLVELAWTAGPVTFIASQGGYYMSYGEFLPPDRMLFFVGYTVIAGVIGLLAKFIYDGTHGRTVRLRQSNLTTVIDRLPELIFAVRNLSSASMSPETRKREAAWTLLRRGALEPDEVALAIEDLTGSAQLAQTAHRVETYRKAGMFLRAQDLLEEHQRQVRLVLDELYATAPAMATTLRDRLEGRGPNLKQGVPREENFIERILAAIGEENEALMTLRDVEEVLILAFELINGRRIPMLTFAYRGGWSLARATDALEEARSNHRIAQATRYSRLTALTTFLAENYDSGLAELTSGQQTTVILDSVVEALDNLAEEIYELRKEVVAGKLTALEELEEKAAVMQTSLRLFRALQRAYRQLGRRHAALVRARQKWEQLSSARRETATRFRWRRGQPGLRMMERTIALDDEEKLEVADALAQRLREINLRRRGRRSWSDEAENMKPLNVQTAKRLAIEVTLVLERYAHISRPEIQRAINAANAAHFGGLEPGSSAAAKAAFAAAVVAEVRKDMAKAAERLAAALVRHYNIELSDGAIDFLHRTYGANTDTLKVLAVYSEPPPAAPFSSLTARPPVLPALKGPWERQLQRAQRLLARHGVELD